MEKPFSIGVVTAEHMSKYVKDKRLEMKRPYTSCREVLRCSERSDLNIQLLDPKARSQYAFRMALGRASQSPTRCT